MKYTLTLLSLSVLGLIVSSPVNATTRPVDTMSISELTFTQLQQAHCYFTSPKHCDSIVEQYAGQIVQRVDTSGALYWINDADGLPIVNHYLPNGFYTGGSTTILAVNGFRYSLTADNAYDRLIRLVNQGGVTGVSEADFAALMKTCEKHQSVTSALSQSYDTCVQERIRGKSLFGSLKGRVIMRANHHGELYYVHTDRRLATPIQKKIGDQSLFEFIKDDATAVSKKKITQLVPAALVSSVDR